MEYAKDVIFNLECRRENLVRNLKGISTRIYSISIVVFNFVKKWTSILWNIIKRNKIISATLAILAILMIADFMLINIFMKIFATLY